MNEKLSPLEKLNQIRQRKAEEEEKNTKKEGITEEELRDREEKEILQLQKERNKLYAQVRGIVPDAELKKIKEEVAAKQKEGKETVLKMTEEEKAAVRTNAEGVRDEIFGESITFLKELLDKRAGAKELEKEKKAQVEQLRSQAEELDKKFFELKDAPILRLQEKIQQKVDKLYGELDKLEEKKAKLEEEEESTGVRFSEYHEPIVKTKEGKPFQLSSSYAQNIPLGLKVMSGSKRVNDSWDSGFLKDSKSKAFSYLIELYKKEDPEKIKNLDLERESNMYEWCKEKLKTDPYFQTLAERYFKIQEEKNEMDGKIYDKKREIEVLRQEKKQWRSLSNDKGKMENKFDSDERRLEFEEEQDKKQLNYLVEKAPLENEKREKKSFQEHEKNLFERTERIERTLESLKKSLTEQYDSFKKNTEESTQKKFPENFALFNKDSSILSLEKDLQEKLEIIKKVENEIKNEEASVKNGVFSIFKKKTQEKLQSDLKEVEKLWRDTHKFISYTKQKIEDAQNEYKHRQYEINLDAPDSMKGNFDFDKNLTETKEELRARIENRRKEFEEKRKILRGKMIEMDAWERVKFRDDK